jgi:hypothetical protein
LVLKYQKQSIHSIESAITQCKSDLRMQFQSLVHIVTNVSTSSRLSRKMPWRGCSGVLSFSLRKSRKKERGPMRIKYSSTDITSSTQQRLSSPINQHHNGGLLQSHQCEDPLQPNGELCMLDPYVSPLNCSCAQFPSSVKLRACVK